MKEVVKNEELIAYCGLYCGACNRYLKDKCPGCQKNEKASWCAVRKCCIENGYRSCADCQTFFIPKECKKFNNFMSKIFGLVFGSDRSACIRAIKERGYGRYAQEMSEKKTHTINK